MKFEITAESHLIRAIELLKKNSMPEKFYCAYELRCCIERILLEYLILLKYPEKLSRSEEREYRGERLYNFMKCYDLEFEKKFEFANIYLEAMGVEQNMRIPNFDRLNEIHGRLGNYLHALKVPEETIENRDWLSQFASFLDSVCQELRHLLEKPHAVCKPTPNTLSMDLYQKFLSGKYTSEQLKNMIKIANINGRTPIECPTNPSSA